MKTKLSNINGTSYIAINLRKWRRELSVISLYSHGRERIRSDFDPVEPVSVKVQ